MLECFLCLEMSSQSGWAVGLKPLTRAERMDAGTGLAWMGSHCTVGGELSPPETNRIPEASNEAGSNRKDPGLSLASVAYHLLSSPTCWPDSASEVSPYNTHFNTRWAPLRCCQSGKLRST